MRQNPARSITVFVGVFAACLGLAPAHYVNFTDVRGESAHSAEFNRDYAAAQQLVTETKSAQPFLDMLKDYDRPVDVAELEYTLGLVYGQRTGVVDVKKSVAHFTKALNYKLPQRAYIDALMLRGGASEQDDDFRAALDDYLRGLLACSHYDLSGGWPVEEAPLAAWDHRSTDPVDLQKARDYRIYRDSLRFKQHVLLQRYYFVEAIKRTQKLRDTKRAKHDLHIDLARLSPPDKKRFKTITKWIKGENSKPWP